jgi:hypothetical protein
MKWLEIWDSHGSELLSSGFRHRVVLQVVTDVSEERVASVNLKDWGDRFLRNDGNHLHDWTASEPRRQQSK